MTPQEEYEFYVIEANREPIGPGRKRHAALSLYPVTIREDRYGGCYSGGSWLAFAGGYFDATARGWDDSDIECAHWWEVHGSESWVAVGWSPDQALTALLDKQDVLVQEQVPEASTNTDE